MNITHVRIDDRLIHGQIIVSWLSYANAKNILIVDDDLVKDSVQQMILKLAVPSGVSFIVKSIADAKSFIENEDKGNTLLIIRNPKNALKLAESGWQPSEINVGNISNYKGEEQRFNILPNFNPNKTDINDLKALIEKGIQLDLRAVPDEKNKNVIQLIDEFK